MYGLREERRGDATVGIQGSKTFPTKVLKEGCVKLHISENNMWNKMAYVIRKVAKETLGELIDFGPTCESRILVELKCSN